MNYLLAKAKEEAERLYPLSDDKYANFIIIEPNRKAFVACVEWFITHLQAQKGERVWREVECSDHLPPPGKDVNGFIMQEYSIQVTAFDKDGESYCGYFHYKSGLFYYRQIHGEQEGATRNITHWLEPAPPLAPENEAVGILEAVYEGAEQWHSEYDSCRALLQELVDLKNIKDSEGKTTDYEARQPLAWAAAKEFLKKYQHL